MAKGKFNFDEMLTALKRAKVDVPKKIAENGQQYFMLNFKKQQSPNSQPWTHRKKETKNSIGKPILVSSGRLRDSMSNTIIYYDANKIIWGTKGIDYAGFLNYGTNKMAARPFIADGREIRGRIKGVIKKEFDKVFLNK